MKRIFLPLLLVGLLAGPAMRCVAKDDKATPDATKPVAVLSIASYDRIMSDVAMIGNMAGNPDLDKNIEGMLKLFTQGQGLAGLDQTRPWGLTLTTDGLSFQPLVFLPVKNLKQLLDALAPLIGDAADGGNGVLELNVFNQKVFVKEQGGWAFIGQSPEYLSNAPKDPLKLLAGLDKTYDVAIRLYVQNIPELYRTLAIDQLRMGVDAGMGRMPDESDEQYGARKKMVQTQIDSLTSAINEVEQLTLGAALNQEAKSAHIDLTVAAVSGSEWAKQLSQVQPATSSFAGFVVPESAASLNVTAKVAKESADQIVAGLQTLRSHAMQHVEDSAHLNDDNSKKLAKDMISEVFDAIQKTLESGQIDAGATLNLSEKSMALVVGAYVADPSALENALKKFAKLAEKEPKFPGIKFNAEKHNGVRFNTTSLPVPKEENISKVIGNKLDVAVGIGEKSVYLAVGNDSISLAKQLIDRSKSQTDKKVPPFQLNVALAPIFKFAAAMQDRPEINAMAEELAKSNGKDRISLVFLPEAGAIRIRLEAQEGVLRLLANAGKMAAGGGGAGLPPAAAK